MKKIIYQIKNTSIKWKIFFYLIGFCSLLIMLMWLFQVVFLDSFYKSIKIIAIRNSAVSIERAIDEDTFTDTIDKVAENNELCVRIIASNGKEVYSSEVLKDCAIHRLPTIELYKRYTATLESGSEIVESYRKERSSAPNVINLVPEKNLGSGDLIIMSKIVTDADGDQYMILLNSEIAPVDSTVQTLRIQIWFITVFMILFSIGLALMISKRVSKPIISINRSAYMLAQGNYEVQFSADGYKEILQLNETLNYTAQQLSQVERLRRELIANISHDLRTPLTLIEGYSEIMRDIPGENTPENIQVIIDETKRLTSLVNDVMDVSKFQAGTQTLNITNFNITQAVRDIIQRFAVLCKQDGYIIEFTTDEEIFVNADELRISQVIYNLINNAINYTGENKRIIASQTRINDEVLIEIIDFGEGIEPEKLKYVWDRYYKVDKVHKRAVVGTGLGLSIVKSIIEMHTGAHCGVSSKLGEGSIFWFRLKID